MSSTMDNPQESSPSILTSNLLGGSPKFDHFDIVEANYKEYNNIPIPASILIPKNIKPGKYPVTVRWHGGGFVTGHRLFADWYPQWTLEFCAMEQAIAVTPDYRLLPEANGLDLLEDVRDLFIWLLHPSHGLSSLLPPGIEADLQHVLVTGESAGGYLAIQSAMFAPANISAVVAHYPMLDLRAPHYSMAYHKDLFTPPAPQVPLQVLADYLRGLRGDEVVTNAIPPARSPLVGSILQQGRTVELLGEDARIYPLQMLEQGGLATPPPTWILHGRDDTVVPVEGTSLYLQVLREKFPVAKTYVTFEDGEHGFDNHDAAKGEAATLETAWVRDGLGFLRTYWPVRT